MPSDLLLDTNTAIALLRLEPSAIAHIATASRIYVPIIALGELYYGAYHSVKVRENVARVESVARHNTILECDAHTADVYGQIVADLESRGQRIPANDIWIAALAIQHNLTLLTRDAHFDRVSGLSAVQW